MRKFRNGQPASMTMPNRFIGKATLRYRLLKAKLGSNKYVYPDDIRQMGKTTELIKMALKSPNSLIVAPNRPMGEYISKKVLELTTKDSFVPRIMSAYQLDFTRIEYRQLKVFVEEGAHLEQLCEFFNTYPSLLDKVVLSYSKLPTKQQLHFYRSHKRLNNIRSTVGMDVEPLTYNLGEVLNSK